MWKKAADVPKETADHILERWDLTDPKIQRETVLQLFLDIEHLRAEIQQLRGDRAAGLTDGDDPEQFERLRQPGFGTEPGIYE